MLRPSGRDPSEAIAGRLHPGSAAALVTGELDGQTSKVHSVHEAPAPRHPRRLQPTRVGPAAHGVGAHPQQLRRFANPCWGTQKGTKGDLDAEAHGPSAASRQRVGLHFRWLFGHPAWRRGKRLTPGRMRHVLSTAKIWRNRTRVVSHISPAERYVYHEIAPMPPFDTLYASPADPARVVCSFEGSVRLGGAVTHISSGCLSRLARIARCGSCRL
jgi:hypothetical protein